MARDDDKARLAHEWLRTRIRNTLNEATTFLTKHSCPEDEAQRDVREIAEESLTEWVESHR